MARSKKSRVTPDNEPFLGTAIANPQSKNVRKRISEVIAGRIRQAIQDGILAAGTRLPSERELAERFKASRDSVREAYRSLETSGLLVVRRGAEGGAFVVDVGHEAVTKSLNLVLQLGKTTLGELTEARLLLEPPVAKLAARRATKEDIAALQQLLKRQAEAVDSNGHPENYDLQFHRLMANCSKNMPMTTLMNSLADLMVGAISEVKIAAETRRHVVHFHELVLDAITRKDEDAAFKLMQSHIGDVQNRLVDSPPKKQSGASPTDRRARRKRGSGSSQSSRAGNASPPRG